MECLLSAEADISAFNRPSKLQRQVLPQAWIPRLAPERLRQRLNLR